MSLIISASPHINSGVTTRSIMRDVLIALAPALIAGTVIFGWRALLVTAVCTASCVFFEWGFEKLCGFFGVCAYHFELLILLGKDRISDNPFPERKAGWDDRAIVCALL